MIEKDILKGLNQEQKKAVTHKNGPLLLIAGAGTGKTMAITRRLAWLVLEKKAKPEEILGLTFTEKAAEEMEDRVDHLLPYGYLDLWISTFHSFGQRILEENALEIGLDPNFRIMTPTDAWQMIRKNIDRFDLNYYRPLGSPTRFLKALVQHFSRLKDEVVAPQEYLKLAEEKKKKAKNDQEKEEAGKIMELAQAYQIYEKIKEEGGLFDFGDLIVKTLELFKRRKGVLEKYRKKFKYILVDEFQDTNWAQYELLKILAQPENNITVTGDDDQSLYLWRGTAYTNLIKFNDDYPKTKVVVLKDNYRNKQNILDLSYNFIQLNNPDRLEVKLAEDKKNQIQGNLNKSLKAVRKDKGVIEYFHFKNQDEEATEVVRKIIDLKKKNRNLSWSDFAILVRANDYANLFIEKLSQTEIPYQFIASRGLYQKPEIMDLIAFLRLVDNYHENSAFYRFVSLPIFKIDLLDLISLMHQSKKKNLSLFEIFNKVDKLSVKASTKKEAKRIIDLLHYYTEMTKKKNVGQVLYDFLEKKGLLRIWTKEKNQESIDRISNLKTFFKKIESFVQTNQDKTVKNFIEQLNLEIEAGEGGAIKNLFEEGPETIKIMTIHQAKGLEFPYVFIVNLVDKRFPSVGRKELIEVPQELIKEIKPKGNYHLQEERRIFYVAMTRARDGLFFTSADDYGGLRKKKPSRFLEEAGFIKKETKLEKKSQQKIDLGISSIDKPTFSQSRNVNLLPKKFSFTQLIAFQACPKQYSYAHVLGVPGKPKFTFSFGQSIHRTLKDFYHLYQKTKKIPKEKELLKIYQKNWLDDWYESKDQELKRKEVGSLALVDFYKKNKKNIDRVKFIEKGFNLKVGDYTIKGVIDRIDLLEKKDKYDLVEIIDYKTGRMPKKKSEIDSEQLLIYALAVKEVFYDLPQKLTYYYFDENKTISFDDFENQLTEIKRRILTTIEEIFKSDFSATPNPWKCHNCDFKEICQDRQL